MDVEIVGPAAGLPAFVDFVLLPRRDPVVSASPGEFPPIGSVFEAVTLDVMPSGELRLQPC